MTFKKGFVGVVGHGFVGTAITEGLKHAFKMRVYDPKYNGGVNELLSASLHDLCSECEVVFVCLPTPMNADGSCNTRLVESVVKTIDEFEYGNVVVVKSTVPPGTTDRLNSVCTNLKGVVFNPEFLTEANHIEDFKNQTRIIIGGEDPAKSIVKNLYSAAYPTVPTIKTSSSIAEMVKYTTNAFLATKVSFANEMNQICVRLNIDYDKVIEYARYDDRLGESHWAVPGPDGKGPGFGGHCFPKDINALIAVAKALGVTPTILQATWEKNLEVREDRDWERMIGRAIVDES